MNNTLFIAASKNNQQPDCGWAAILNGKLLSGNLSNATIRQAEMTALKRAASMLKPGDTLQISARHPHLQAGLNSLDKWKKSNWKRKNGKPIQNKALWLNIESILSGIKVEFLNPNDNAAPHCQARLIAQASSGKILR